MNPPLSRTALAAVLIALCASLMPAAAVAAQRPVQYQQQARAVTNDKRADHGLAELRRGDCVQKYARRQARKMARQDRMFHQDLGSVLTTCGLTGVAENVAAGYPTGRAAVIGWMHSSGHRANLLAPTYQVLGMAVRRSADGTPYAAQVFGRG